MIVWQDMVNGAGWLGAWRAGVLPNVNIHISDKNYKAFHREDPASRNRFCAELREMLDTLYNCVSIGCWVPFNEGWGQFDAKEIGQWVKSYDPTRVVDHASGWHDQGGPDLKSVHKYILPVRLPKPDGRPFVLSEFGGYSQIVDGHVFNRKKSFGYKMYKRKAALTRAYRKLIERQILPLIPKGLCAFVYTQVSDVELEVNGLMTYDRAVIKLEENTVKELNAQCVFHAGSGV